MKVHKIGNSYLVRHWFKWFLVVVGINGRVTAETLEQLEKLMGIKSDKKEFRKAKKELMEDLKPKKQKTTVIDEKEATEKLRNAKLDV